MAHLEGAYEQVSQRLNGIDLRLAGLEQKVDSSREVLLAHMNDRFAAVDQRFMSEEKRFDQKFLWVMGLVIVSILLPLVQRFVPHG
jgi:hypothetical protein